jgi:hypothetical protein
VTNRYLVLFSIGKRYSDQIWYNAIPIDACHLLLGRSSKYDSKVQHDGFKNTYFFIKDGVKVILGLSKLGLIFKPFKQTKTLLITYTKMKRFVNYVNLVYTLVVFYENAKINELPLKMQHLHDEFSKIVRNTI